MAVCGRSADIIKAAAEELRDEGHEVIDIVFDAQKRDDVQRLIDTTLGEFG